MTPASVSALPDERVEMIARIEAALEQAQDCIRGERPEDATDAEAKADTISKIRECLFETLPALALLPAPSAWQGMVETYDEYIALLTESERGLLGLAHAHGYRCPDKLVQRGKELREQIAAYKSQSPPAPLPVAGEREAVIEECAAHLEKCGFRYSQGFDVPQIFRALLQKAKT